MKTNDILLACDGYSNIYYFMQVVKATDKTVTVRRIRANKEQGTPCPNQFLDGIFGHPLNKRVKNERISLGGWCGARVWDGKPLHNEHPMWGTNYNLY